MTTPVDGVYTEGAVTKRETLHKNENLEKEEMKKRERKKEVRENTVAVIIRGRREKGKRYRGSSENKISGS